MFSTTTKLILCIETQDLLMLLGSSVSFAFVIPQRWKLQLELCFSGCKVGYLDMVPGQGGDSQSWRPSRLWGGHWHMMAEVQPWFFPTFPAHTVVSQTGMKFWCSAKYHMCVAPCLSGRICPLTLLLAWEGSHETSLLLDCQQRWKLKMK